MTIIHEKRLATWQASFAYVPQIFGTFFGCSAIFSFKFFAVKKIIPIFALCKSSSYK